MTRYTFFVIDFEVDAKSNHSDIIQHFNDNIFDNGVIRSVIYVRLDGTRKIRIYVLIRIHNPVLKTINDETHELTIPYQDDKTILTKAYMEPFAPEFI